MMKDLFDIGPRGRLPKFISSFLSDRSFNARIGSTLSDTYEQEQGVPQGSFFYPLLYLISKLITLLNVLMILTPLCTLMISVSFIKYGEYGIPTIKMSK